MRKIWKTFKILLVLIAVSLYLRKEEFLWQMNFGMKSYHVFTNNSDGDSIIHKMNPAFQYNIEAFESSFKNPCYRTEDGDALQCLPYTFITGMPKCGTTDVYFFLSSHPNVENTFKEPHWWTRQRFVKGNQKLRYPLPLKSYLKIYENPSKNIAQMKTNIIVDGSASTLWDMDYWSYFVNYTETPGAEPEFITAHYIKQLLPQAKMIVLLRDPVDRLYSDYLYFSPEEASPQDFHHKVLTAVGLMTECIQKYGIRSCVYNVYLNEHNITVRVRIGIYYVFLQDWFSVFQMEQFLVIRLEDYYQRRESYLQQMCTFLNISYSINKGLLTEGKAKSNKRNLKRQGDMLPETRSLLKNFYQPFNDRLAELFHSDSYKWT